MSNSSSASSNSSSSAPVAPIDVAPEAVRALGLVHRHVVERAAVVGPRRRRHLLDRPVVDAAAGEVLDVEREVAPAGDVGRVGEPHRVARDGRQAEAQERLVAGQLVQVEQGLVDAVRRRSAGPGRRRAGAGSAGTARPGASASRTTSRPFASAPSRRPAGCARTSPGRASPSAPRAARTRRRRRRSPPSGRRACADRRGRAARSSRRRAGRRAR